ncbi:MAG: HD domain-containing phosphohydrolase [Thermodesulfobacteriota bacterium]
MNILIVEDRVEDRKLLRMNVERHGHTSMEAADGREGLAMATRYKPDLIISDALMPGMDGFQLLREVKQDKTLESIPFVFYSSVYTGQKEEELAYSLGAAAFIVKPKEPEEFWMELERIIESDKLNRTSPKARLKAAEEEYLDKYAHIVAAKLEEKVAELEQVKSEIEKSEKKYRLIAENVRDVIWTLDMDFNYTYVSPSVSLLRGYTVEEIMGQNFEKTLSPDSIEVIRRVITEELANEEQEEKELKRFRTYELEMVHKNGSTVWAEIKVSFLRDESGKAIGVLGVSRDISERKRAEGRLVQTLANLREGMYGIVRAMALTIEARDPYTAGHQRRVADLARSIGQEMGLSENQVEGLRVVGVIHDLGKIAVPAEILSKPTKLTTIEFELIKTHPQTGFDILKDIEFPWPVARMVLEHHERINGSGYPNGLKEDALLLESKILMVADVVEAIASHRPYRPAYGIGAALEEIEKNRGVLYDPDVVDSCLRLFREKGYKFEV